MSIKVTHEKKRWRKLSNEGFKGIVADGQMRKVYRTYGIGFRQSDTGSNSLKSRVQVERFGVEGFVD